ncbi:fumarylacetoacetate hydrolase family protein [Fodinibacter luteus]|uniref:Fumarylacetoacetate hydrolase family protein n=1 Tax=Fodinibacter luteus TaxID=552064 RepID=A0ABP8KPZ8_9MICO
MDVSSGADRLERARSTLEGLPLFSRDATGLTDEEAWAIAAEVDRRLLSRGRQRTGYKLGWTSAAMREALGIDTPNFGSLWDDMATTGTLALSTLRHPKAEPEFAFRADQALSGAGIGAADVMRSGRWAVALEVVDPRWESYDFTWLDNTADGSSAAAYALGPFVEVDVAPEDLSLTMTWGGERRSGGGRRSGDGRAAMGSPAEAVAYLLAELTHRGTRLEAGMIVLTGGITAPVDLRPGLEVDVSSPQLGSCTLVCT